MTSNPIKIIYVFRHFADIGGMQRVLIDKMNYLAENGFLVTVITCEQGEHPFAFDLSSLVKHIDTNHRFFTLYKYQGIRRLYEGLIMELQFTKKLQSLSDEINPDFIITSVEPLITRAISKLRTPAKWIVESHVPMRFTLFESDFYQTIQTNFVLRLYERFIFKPLRKCDLLVTLTHDDAVDWEKWNKNTYVIPNPVTLYPEEIKEPSDNNRIIFVGRLNQQKGIDYLIDAFNLIAHECPKWEIEIFGSGDLEVTLNEKIKTLRLEDRIIINPPTNHIYDEYMDSQFYVMSSRYEGFPLVLLEALSCGLPCVSFRCIYGPEDIIEDGINGLLVQDRNIEDLAQKMLWMCNHPRERAEMRICARKTASDYKKEKIMPIWVQLFQHMHNGSFSFQQFSKIQQTKYKNEIDHFSIHS